MNHHEEIETILENSNLDKQQRAKLLDLIRRIENEAWCEGGDFQREGNRYSADGTIR